MNFKTARPLAIVATASVVFGASQATRAADLPPAPAFKAPVAVAGPSWTGFYFNGGGGYGLWSADTTTSIAAGSPAAPVLPIQRQGGRGWLGRVGGGFDYQFTSRIVAGVFADFDISSIGGTIIDAAPGNDGQIKQKWSWAAGGRVGWLLTPQLLSYFNAGYINARFSSAHMVSAGGPLGPAGTPSGFMTPAFNTGGWFLGGGTEMALTALGSGWFWRNEYRYAYYGNHSIADNNISSPLPFPAFNNINFKPTVQTVTTQLVYKFNPGVPAPVFQAAPAATPGSWTGVYVSGGGGYGLWAADTTTTFSPIKQTQGGKGWLGRVGGGADYQFNPKIVAGVFADFDFSSLKGTLQDQALSVAGDIKQTRSWSVGGRLGWLVTPAVLTYVNGGYTNARFSSVNLRNTLPPGLAGTPSGLGTGAFTTDGWFLGGGTESSFALFGNGWFWRNEYRYARYGSMTISENVLGTNGVVANTATFKPGVQTVTTQLVYKFSSR